MAIPFLTLFDYRNSHRCVCVFAFVCGLRFVLLSDAAVVCPPSHPDDCRRLTAFRRSVHRAFLHPLGTANVKVNTNANANANAVLHHRHPADVLSLIFYHPHSPFCTGRVVAQDLLPVWVPLPGAADFDRDLRRNQRGALLLQAHQHGLPMVVELYPHIGCVR